MKKLSLKNLKLEVADVLQRNQLKNILGGYGGYDDDGCSVSCATGYFACCKENGFLQDRCKCVKNGESSYTCDHGGPGSTSCSWSGK